MGATRRVLAVASWTCLAGVLAYLAALRLVGESWWGTTVALYLPHVVLLAPVVALALLLVAVGPRRHVLVQAAAAAVVLFPIMGLTLSGPARATPDAPRLRVLSFNTDSGRRSVPEIVADVLAGRPDVVLLQESGPPANEAVAAALPGFETRTSSQFFVASRFPIVELHEPPKVRLAGVDRSPRFIRLTIDTPLGRLAVFNVHPISPRDALDSVHGPGVLVGHRTGALFEGDRRIVTRNTALRRLQVEAIADLAASSPHPVIVAGDTNLPGGSRLLSGTLGGLRDGFAEVGRGFGYTFPVGRRGAWMRIDRVLAGPELRFLEFGVGQGRGSDHRCVWAELERAPGG
jgi:endonuclease/exonuclease/phosphatase (EEP) superfamily protein YafD